MGILIRKLVLNKCKFCSMRDRGNTVTKPAAECAMAGNGRSYCKLLDHLFLYTSGILNMRSYEINDVCVLHNNSFMMYLCLALVGV